MAENDKLLKTKVDLNGKVILVTGTAGFIGSNLAMRLLKSYEKVTVIGIDSITDYNPI
ncbi:MAG: NAD-dependent epimerase/dehydratase family protein, partial [Lachnospiraceae bacterium]|nr:NAD-dependent epimerase/dehydratase family protein [Lachnospiraceae bacterium]